MTPKLCGKIDTNSTDAVLPRVPSSCLVGQLATLACVTLHAGEVDTQCYTALLRAAQGVPDLVLVIAQKMDNV